MEGLDGVRALAIIPVVLLHLGLYFSKEWNDLFRGGFLGVDLFFVLSSFLITLLLTREHAETGTIAFGRFYARRALRLLPAIFALVFLHGLYAYFTGLNWELEKSALLSILFYYSNYKIATSLVFPDGLGHMWSLAVEEQFYFVWPVLLLLTASLRREPKKFVAILIAGIAAVVLWRMWLWSGRPSGDYYSFTLYIRTDTRIDTLLIGALFAVLPVSDGFARRWFPLMGFLSLIALLFCFAHLERRDSFLYVGGFTLLSFLSGTLIFTVARVSTWWTGIFRNIVLRSIGKVSYGIYIWHMPAFAITARYTEGQPLLLRVSIALTAMTVVTLLSWFYLEKPFLRLKSRFSAPH